MRFILAQTCRCPGCDTRIGTLTNFKLGLGECPICHLSLDEFFYNRTFFKSSTNNHKTKLKLIINPILRKLQFFTDSPYVIASLCHVYKQYDEFTLYVFQKYTLLRVKYLKTTKENK